MGQKAAVVAAVKSHLPNFVPYQQVALVMLSKDQLEAIKISIARDIEAGCIEYSKDYLNWSEVLPYARSMVMNHLKKAKELNGNQTYGKTTAQVATVAKSKALSDIDMELLPNDLAQFVQNLV